MTTETRKRIRAYKRMLPELRERVIAVALLLAMSVSMLGTASYAWITLSRAPEVTGMQTTVAANGNLEIALASGLVKDGLVPPVESAVGDSASADKENWGMVNANVTWGNLVNISDDIYGLNKIELRPAMLNEEDLANKPLNGASYGKDGRVIDTIQDYSYASVEKIGQDSYEFAAGDGVKYGVRAISSMKSDNKVGNQQIETFKTEIRRAYSAAANNYNKLVTDDTDTATKFNGRTAVAALQDMVSVFANDKVSDGDSSYDGSIWYLHQMMIELKSIMDEYEGVALLNLANMQAYIANGNTKADTYKTLEELIAAYDAKTLADGVDLESLASFVTDYKKLTELIENMAPMAESCHPDKVDRPDIKWSQIDDEYINHLVNISTATIDAAGLDKETKVTALGLSTAMGLLGEKQAKIRIYDGILKNTEARAIPQGSRLNAYVTVKAMNVPVSGTVFTKVREKETVPVLSQDMSDTFALDNSGAVGQLYAKDTYGMAIDFWVRTNAPNSVLTLEGTTIYQENPVTIKIDGKDVQVWELTVKTEDNVDLLDIYQNPTDQKWYNFKTNGELSEDYVNSGTKKEKVDRIPIDFQGENRIWEDWESLLDLGYIAQDATTQGAGSCFVFYAANPAEQSKMLELLSAISIVFVDDSATKVATAQLDLESAYINQGKITAPLKITDKGVEYTDEDGNIQKGIMNLPVNTPVWLSAIIYMDGESLQNENVLADNNITGQLNLQFGNNLSLGQMEVWDDEELQMQHRSLSVSANYGSTISNNSDEPITLEYDTAGHVIEVTATVDGDQPESISAAFVRVINATQGTRGEIVEFTHNEDDTWTSSFTLKAPGEYVLSELTVNGLSYRLKEKSGNTPDNHPKVVIDGLSVDYINSSVSSGIVRTTSKTLPVTVTAKITADPDLTPKLVWAQFFNENKTKQYNAKLEFNPDKDGGVWEGTAILASSDTYILEFLSIDGEVTEIPDLYKTRLECDLGLKCRVDWQGVVIDENTYDKSTTEFLYEGKPFNLRMKATITDDTDTALDPMEGVHLYYRMDGVDDDIDGMHAPMTWNEAGYYEATLELDQPGIFSFHRLETGGETDSLREAVYSPVFTATSPVPPSYVDASVSAQERSVSIDAANPATMTVQLKDASAAVVWAQMQKLTKNDAGEYVPTGDPVAVMYTGRRSVTLEDGTTAMEYQFPLTQDGIWRVERILCQNVWNGMTQYPLISDNTKETYEGPATTANSYVVEIPAEQQAVTEVIATVNAKLVYGGKEYYNSVSGDRKELKVEFGGTKDANTGVITKTGTMFQQHKNEELKLVLTDYKGTAFEEDIQAKWAISYSNGRQSNYGGYTGGTWSVNQNGFAAMSRSGTDFVAPEVVFDLAGDYSSSISAVFDLDGDGEYDDYTYNVPVKPELMVYSVTPSLTASAITPTGSNAAKVTYTTKNLSWGRGTEPTFTATGNQTSQIDTAANKATVYAVATADNSTQRHGSFTRPTLTVTVAGVTSDSTVSFTLPGGSADAITFTRTGNGTIKNTLGKVSQIKSWTSNFILTHTLDAYYGHGSQTITTMSVVRNGVTYTVTLDKNLIVNNPNSVNQ